MKRFFAKAGLLLSICLSISIFLSEGQEAPRSKKNIKSAPPVSAAVSAPSQQSVLSYGPTLNAKQAILLDVLTGEVLFEKNADEKMPPSSMSKIMTTYLVFKELKAGRLKMSTLLPVSEKAWRKQGSKMFLSLNDQVSVEDLLRGAIIQSGNDACITLAEGVSGSEETFAQQMTEVAKELGVQNSHFVNSTGWPDENHYSTARDLAVIAQKLIEDFPTYYPLYAEREFTFNKIRQDNRNPLLASFPGADGLKTGSTDAGGFGLVGTAVQERRRLIMVINGADSEKMRSIDSKALLQWGFSNFPYYKLYSAGAVVDQAEVWLGKTAKVNLTVKQNVGITVPKQDSKNLKVSLVYTGPLPAPLKADQHVANLVISRPQKADLVIPVVTAEAVEKASLFASFKAACVYLFKGHN